MSFDAFNNNKDQEIKRNLENTIDPKKKTKTQVSIDQIKNVMPERKEKKHSITFSLTESQIDKLDYEAQKRGFKNRSQFIAEFIDLL